MRDTDMEKTTNRDLLRDGKPADVLPEGIDEELDALIRGAQEGKPVKKADEVLKAKGKSQYGPGKHPNSHKKALSNAKASMAAARKAKLSGDKGAASLHVKEARVAVRTARQSSTAGLSTTEGASAFYNYQEAVKRVKSGMARARRMKARGDDKKLLALQVRWAREDNKEARNQAAKSKVTKAKSKVTKASKKAKRTDVDFFVPIVKQDKKEQIVYGWASPVNELGTEITDRQGDVIDIQEVRDAAHDFMLNKRVGGAMHKTFDAGQVVESIVFDADLQKALGIDLPYEGWFIGVKISKTEDWAKVEDGTYTGFSIGGSGIREKMEKGYAQGKHPNSHKKGARDGNVNPHAKEQTLNRAKAHLDAARTAKAKGDKGATSYHAVVARGLTRSARGLPVGAKSNFDTRNEDLKWTAGAKLHTLATDSFADAKFKLGSARGAKMRGADSTKVKRMVSRAKSEQRRARRLQDASRVTKSQPSAAGVHVAGPIHPKGCQCKNCRRAAIGKRIEVLKARKKSQYGPGKNPASHGKRGGAKAAPVKPIGGRNHNLANRSDDPTRKKGGTASYGQDYTASLGPLNNARQYLRSARKAKESGDKGKTSYFANMARTSMRAATQHHREALTNHSFPRKTLDANRTSNIPRTKGAQAYIDSKVAGYDKKKTMERARDLKMYGYGPENRTEISRTVRAARAHGKKERQLRNTSRMTKSFDEIMKARKKSQYAIGKNPNSHKGKGGGTSMSSQGSSSSGKLLLQKPEGSSGNRVSGGRKEHQPKPSKPAVRVNGYKFTGKSTLTTKTAAKRKIEVFGNASDVRLHMWNARQSKRKGDLMGAAESVREARRSHEKAKLAADPRKQLFADAKARVHAARSWKARGEHPSAIRHAVKEARIMARRARTER